MKHYALIPAKKNSSRCPNKNWRIFYAGQNLVTHLISLIPENFFEKIILSTDKIKLNVSDKVLVHNRDKSLATKDSPVNDLISLIIDQFNFEDDSYIWLLNPTSPFRKREDFFKIRDKIDKDNPKSVITLSVLHPFIWLNDQPLFDLGYPRKNTQDIEIKCGFENGQFIIFLSGEFKKTKTWYSDKIFFYRQKGYESILDIDTENNFLEAQQLAQYKYSRVPASETMKNETLAIDDIISTPFQEHTGLIFNHFNRYATALQRLNINEHERLIDASCGLGYGTYILSLKAKEVIGLDPNKVYLEKAKSMYKSDGLHFFTYDEYTALIDSNKRRKADKIICIETFEHISKRESWDYIRTLISFLKKNGDLFLTTPIGENQPSPYNDFHLNEPSIEKLYDFFEKLFGKITFEIESYKNSFGYNEKFCFLLLKSFKGANDEVQSMY
jgi:CMP-N-acetylneuraminic acid synthetase/SAM-dependent methyltransferase